MRLVVVCLVLHACAISACSDVHTFPMMPVMQAVAVSTLEDCADLDQRAGEEQSAESVGKFACDELMSSPIANRGFDQSLPDWLHRAAVRLDSEMQVKDRLCSMWLPPLLCDVRAFDLGISVRICLARCPSAL